MTRRPTRDGLLTLAAVLLVLAFVAWLLVWATGGAK